MRQFLASGLNDAEGFVLRISLLDTLGTLVSMPIAAVALSFMGALSNAWLSTRSRNLTIVAAGIMSFVLVAGAGAIWYADALERAARPPFIIAGLVAAAVAVCTAHPIWSSLATHRPAS